MYKPSIDLLEGLRNLFPLEICPWDDYYLRMAQTDFLLGRARLSASKSYFFREAPFKGSYALLGGLTAFIRVLNDYEFNSDVAIALEDQGYKKEFIDYLVKDLKKVKVTVHAPFEGSIILPNEPAVIWEGDLISVRIAEGIALKNLNFPTLSLTKWHRVNLAASPGSVMEFARRRAQDDLRTSLYAYLGGCNFSSNSEIRRGFDINIRGTMGHEYIQSFGNEYEAFCSWLEINSDRPVLLVDTIDTLRSGIPNAIKAFKRYQDKISEAGGEMGIRNDSGDLAYITIEERLAFQREKLQVKIYETNDLDEYSIENIREQLFTQAPKAGIVVQHLISDIIWACGTKPGTCYDQPSLGGVAKLSSIDNKSVIKLAKDNPIKTSIPGCNRSAFVWNNEELVTCLIYNKNEDPYSIKKANHINDEEKFIDIDNCKFTIRQINVYDPIMGIKYNPTLKQIREHIKQETDRLHWTNKRLLNPHSIKVSVSPKIFKLRKKMIENNQLIED